MVEQRSPKPPVGGSSPPTPARFHNRWVPILPGTCYSTSLADILIICHFRPQYFIQSLHGRLLQTINNMDVQLQSM